MADYLSSHMARDIIDRGNSRTGAQSPVTASMYASEEKILRNLVLKPDTSNFINK
jgi:hypothetical protein